MAVAKAVYQPPPILTKPELVPVTIQQPDDAFLVLFDLETTSLEKDADICCIAAMPLSDKKIWEKFIIPRESIHPRASEINELSVIEDYKGNRSLLKGGKKVEAISYAEGMNQFYQYINHLFEEVSRNNPNMKIVLVAHNAFNFDARVLIYSLVSVTIKLTSWVDKNIGFADSLSILQEMRREGEPLLMSQEGDKKKSLSLSNLTETLFTDSHTAHDAVEDVQGLYKVLFESELEVTTERILSHSCTIKSFIQKMNFDIKTSKRMRTFVGNLTSSGEYRCKDKQVTNQMARKMAESGLTYEDLTEVYEKEGEEGLERVLKEEREDGKPRVTKDKRVINTVINHFKDYKEVDDNLLFFL